MDNEQGTITNQETTEIPNSSFFAASFLEKLFAVLSFPLAYFYVWLLFHEEVYTSTVYWLCLAGFAVLFCIWTEIQNLGRKGNKERWVWMAMMALCLAGPILGRSNVWEREESCLFIHAFAIYYVLCRSNTLLEGETGRMLPIDAVFGACIFPFGQFILRIRSIVAIFRDRKKSKKRINLWSIAAVLLGILLLIWVVNLLSKADSEFNQLVSRLFSLKLGENVGEYIIYFVFSLPVGAYLYGLVAGSARTLPDTMLRRGGKIFGFFEKLHKVPVRVWTVVLVVFSVVYLVFFGIQGSYLFGAFTRTLPEDFTVAEYARQGFFELCKVLTLNFALLFFAMCSAAKSARESRLMRVMATIVLIESLLLAVTAASKLWLYIDCFGFTPLRLQSAWLICVLAAGCIASLWSIWTSRKSVRVWAIFSAVTLSILHFF